jgi:hypothetical protein
MEFAGDDAEQTSILEGRSPDSYPKKRTICSVIRSHGIVVLVDPFGVERAQRAAPRCPFTSLLRFVKGATQTVCQIQWKVSRLAPLKQSEEFHSAE